MELVPIKKFPQTIQGLRVLWVLVGPGTLGLVALRFKREPHTAGEHAGWVDIEAKTISSYLGPDYDDPKHDNFSVWRRMRSRDLVLAPTRAPLDRYFHHSEEIYVELRKLALAEDARRYFEIIGLDAEQALLQSYAGERAHLFELCGSRRTKPPQTSAAELRQST